MESEANSVYGGQIPPALQRNIGFLLNRSSRILREEMNAALAPLLLNVNDYAIMRIIENGQVTTQQQAAERHGMDSSSMVELVDRLEKRGILTREKNMQDRRSYCLLLTPKGRKTLTRAKRIAEGVHKKFLEPLDDTERDIIYVALAKLVANKVSREMP